MPLLDPGRGLPARGLTAPGSPVCPPAWLALREPADAAARDTELVALLRAALRPGPLEVRDLGSGTGSMGRWLAPRLPGPQRWRMHDRDEVLLALAELPPVAADGSPVTLETCAGDLTALAFAGTSLVTAAALLDLLTAGEIERLAADVTAAGCPALLTGSVSGHVRFTPAEPLDAELAAAFDAHQRRTVAGRRLLGPDAPDAAAAAFERRGARVVTRPGDWQLGPADAELARAWLLDWVAAAVEQRPELAAAAAGYLARRLATCAAGELHVVVGHTDLLALPEVRR